MNINEINELIEIMKENNLKLLEVSNESQRYKIEFNNCIIEDMQLKPKTIQEVDDIKIINSPMPGAAYRSFAPNEKPFIEVLEFVKSKETICIIEAMKVQNEIKAEENCEIIEIYFKDGEMVEYGQPLFKIRIRGE